MQEVKVLNYNIKDALRYYVFWIIAVAYSVTSGKFELSIKSILIILLISTLCWFGVLISRVKSKNSVVLIINEKGLTHKELFGFIPWNDIGAVKLFRYGLGKHRIGITLDVVNIEERINNLTKDEKATTLFEHKKGKPIIKIEGPLTPEIEKVYDLISDNIKANMETKELL